MASPSLADPIPASLLNKGHAAQYYPPSVRKKFPAEMFTTAPFSTQTPRYADIGYEFDERKYVERTAARLQAGGLRTDLPTGWPKALDGPLVWTGSEFPDESSFVYCLSESDKTEIKDALAHFKGLGIEEKDVGQSSFPLPSLGKTLSNIRTDIYHGRGFATLRGLDVDSLSPDDLVTVYLGITSYVAERRGKQNQDGVMMIHVLSHSKEAEHENAHVQIPFHTDLVCDTVAMLTVSCGEAGGSGIVAPAWTVYNDLASTRPDLIRVLAEPNWPFDTHGRDPPYHEHAILYFEDGKLLTNFSRRSLVGQKTTGPRTPGIPGLTEAQAEALGTLHATGRRHELRQSMMKGDIRFLNNLAVMHRRDTYVDSKGNHRHLLRLWLHNESSCWKLPMSLQLAWERTFRDTEREEQWHFVKYSCTDTPYTEPIWVKYGPENPKPDPPPTVQCD